MKVKTAILFSVLIRLELSGKSTIDLFAAECYYCDNDILVVGHHMPVLHDYMSVVEAADVLGVHWETVKRLCREGRIPAEKVHNKWLIHKDSLHEFAMNYNEPRRGKRRNRF